MNIGLRNNKLKNESAGFTLVEMVIVVSIFAILLGIIVPSVGSLTRFRANKTTQELTAALDQTRTEAMSRLVGQLRIFKDSDGNYCIQYYLDRGKNSGYVVPSQEEIIAGKNSRVNIKYYLEGDSEPHDIPADPSGLVISYDRDTGGFLPVKFSNVTSDEMKVYWDAVEGGERIDLPIYNGDKQYCEKIVVYRGDTKYRAIELIRETGKYVVS